MKKLKKLFFILISLIPGVLFSVSNDPGDLINAAKRGRSITELYLNRWYVVDNSYSMKELDEMEIQERFYYINRGGYAKNVDLYVNLEYIPNLPVTTQFRNQEHELALMKIFASTIIRFDEVADLGFAKYGFAVSVSGYRYGMKNEVRMNDGTDPHDNVSIGFKTKEYVYSQMYDDLIVLTNILEPFIYLHTGLLINKQIKPGWDSIYGNNNDTEESIYKLFLHSNILGSLTLDVGYNSNKDKTEFFSTKLEILGFLALPIWGAEIIKRRGLWPDFYIGYSYENTELTSEEDEFGQKREPVHTLFFEILYTFYNAFYIKARADLFLYGRNDLEKDYPFKQAYFEFGIGRDILQIFIRPEKYYKESRLNRNYTFYFIFGISHFTDSRLMNFWDEEAAEDEKDKPQPFTRGYSLGFKFVMTPWKLGITLEVKMHRNYAPKIYHLVEGYNRWFYEFSCQIAF